MYWSAQVCRGKKRTNAWYIVQIILLLKKTSQICEKRLLASPSLPLLHCVRNSVSTQQIVLRFYGRFLLYCFQKTQFQVKTKKLTGHLHKDPSTFVIILLFMLHEIKFQIKVEENIKIQVSCNATLFSKKFLLF